MSHTGNSNVHSHRSTSVQPYGPAHPCRWQFALQCGASCHAVLRMSLVPGQWRVIIMHSETRTCMGNSFCLPLGGSHQSMIIRQPAVQDIRPSRLHHSSSHHRLQEIIESKCCSPYGDAMPSSQSFDGGHPRGAHAAKQLAGGAASIGCRQLVAHDAVFARHSEARLPEEHAL
jgi:hypothetical protein